jgi:hypothetical protein
MTSMAALDWFFDRLTTERAPACPPACDDEDATGDLLQANGW